MNRLRLLPCLLAAPFFTLLLALAGCSGDSQDSGEPPTGHLEQQVLQALELEGDGDWEGSMRTLEALVAEHPDDADLRLMLGRAYGLMAIKTGADAGDDTAGHEYDLKALEQYRQAVDLAPDLADARIRLASSLFRQDENQAAMEHLALVLEQNPGNRDAHWHMGSILWGESRLAEARTHFLVSLGQDLDPDLEGQERTFSYDQPSGYATTSGHRRAAHVELRFVIEDPVLYQTFLSRQTPKECYLSVALILAVSSALKDLPDQPAPEEIERAEQEALDLLLHRWDNLSRVGLRPVSLSISNVSLLP